MSAASNSGVFRHVPSELLEEILLKLPIKSLVRFSTVSKSWLFMITGSGFVQEHKRRAAVSGVKRMVTLSLYDHLDRDTRICRIPLTSSMGIDDSTHPICPIEGTLLRLRAFCDGLWLVEAENVVETEDFRFEKSQSVAVNYRRLLAWKYPLLRKTEKTLHLWNPSTRAHRKLPGSPLLTAWPEFVYGLGYDSVADDYKVLKIGREKSIFPVPTELYSLKSDSWKTISPPSGLKWAERCEYVNGSLHWIRTFGNKIVSFDLSTEKCGEIMFPAVALDSDHVRKYLEVVVMRGMLCVSVNNANSIMDDVCFVLWMMEEYGVVKSWTKMLSIDYGFLAESYFPYGNLRPVHFYDNGDILLVKFILQLSD